MHSEPKSHKLRRLTEQELKELRPQAQIPSGWLRNEKECGYANACIYWDGGLYHNKSLIYGVPAPEYLACLAASETPEDVRARNLRAFERMPDLNPAPQQSFPDPASASRVPTDAPIE